MHDACQASLKGSELLLKICAFFVGHQCLCKIYERNARIRNRGIMEPHKTWPRQWLESAGVLGWDASVSNDTLSLNTQLDTLDTVRPSRQWVLLGFRIPLVWQRSSGKINEIDSIRSMTKLSSELPWTTSCMGFLHILYGMQDGYTAKSKGFLRPLIRLIGCIGSVE